MEMDHIVRKRLAADVDMWELRCSCGWRHTVVCSDALIAAERHLSDAVKVVADGLFYSDKPWTNGRATVGKLAEVPVPRVGRRYSGISWETRIGYMVMFTCGYWLAWALR